MLRSADAPVWRAPAQAQRALPIESQRSPNGRTPSRKNHRWATGVAFFLADEHGKPSVHPLRGDEIRALRELRRQFQDSKHVFGTERGGPFTPDAVNRLIKRIGERAGFDFLVHVHMLRHACGYALANAGHDTRALQVAAVSLPQHFMGPALNPLFRTTVRGAYKIRQKTQEMMADAYEQVEDIVAEVDAEGALKASKVPAA
jgi:integrase